MKIEDRQPWLESLRAELEKHDAEGQNMVLACSALKRDYRKMLAVGPGVRFVYLKGDAQRITERLRARQGHFAGEKILAGQFADLEEPDGAVVVDIDATPEAMVREIREKLRCKPELEGSCSLIRKRARRALRSLALSQGRLRDARGSPGSFAAQRTLAQDDNPIARPPQPL